MLTRRLRGRNAVAAAVTMVAVLALSACGTEEDGLAPGIEPGDDGGEPGDLDGPDEDVREEQEQDAGSDPGEEQEQDVGNDTREDGDPGEQPREVALAIADAADRTGVAPDSIEVVAFEEVTWPDGAMGCPQPGQMYTQALVEGYRVLLEVDGSQLSYHGARGGDPSLCEDPQEPLEDRG